MSASLSTWLRRLDRRVPWPALLAAGVLVLLGLRALETRLRARTAAAAPGLAADAAAQDDLDVEIAERRSLKNLVAANLDRAKRDAASLSRSRRVLFEGGLALSEEKRLLEKQWEIMTTWVLIDPAADRVQVMHGDQIDQILPLKGARERAVGGERRALPAKAVIVSKERYAHPERGKSEESDGRLDWDPPQVGTSSRARALGQYVLFTREGLIIHGPPLDKKEHEAYPHLCLTLPLAVARQVYARTFIGTTVVFKPALGSAPAAP